MWSLFIKLPAMLGISTMFLSFSGGMNFVVVASSLNLIQRVKGFKAGEGLFTERANHKYYGVVFDKNSENELCSNLGLLAEAAPGLLGKFLSRYDLTASEGNFVLGLTIPALETLHDIVELNAIENPGPEITTMLRAVAGRFAQNILPVSRWFEQFPTTRTKRI